MTSRTAAHDSGPSTLPLRRVRTALLSTALLACFLACGPTVQQFGHYETTRPTAKASAPGLDRIRAAYDAGWNAITAALPPASNVGSGEDAYARLRQLTAFRSEHVRWGTLRQDAPETSARADNITARLVIVPVGDPLLRKMAWDLEIHANPEPLALLIQPAPVTDRWAGIFLAHELSHLHDLSSGFEPADASRSQFLLGELRAFNVEMQAVSLLTGGNFEHELDRLLEKWNPSGVADVAQRARRISSKDLAALESAFPTASPASEAELRLRLGFYTMALASRYADLHDLGSDGILAVLDGLYSKA